MNEKKHILEYDILRVGVTLLVVVSHCMYYRIESAYGGIDYMYLEYYYQQGRERFRLLLR